MSSNHPKNQQKKQKGQIGGDVRTAHWRHIIVLHLWACCKKD